MEERGLLLVGTPRRQRTDPGSRNCSDVMPADYWGWFHLPSARENPAVPRCLLGQALATTVYTPPLTSQLRRIGRDTTQDQKCRIHLFYRLLSRLGPHTLGKLGG